ncbi:MAG: hypothetical protein JW807_13515 [Spirochaetes bacterium]|nr:hypothetical protein [Spirochaetota bacterium]
MSKHNTRFSVICGLILSAAITLTPAGAAIQYEWGTELEKVKKSLPSDRESTQFTPRDKQNYKNKILSYITAIDADLADKIIILRLETRPVTDFLFVKDRLYTVMEDWGRVDEKTEKEIHAKLAGLYGKPLVQQDKSFFIYSYSNDTTKVLYYLMKLPEGKSQCKVYYYTRQLFKMLISE